MTYFVLICFACLVALIRAYWQGARPNVVAFGADSSAAALNRLRRVLRLPLRETDSV